MGNGVPQTPDEKYSYLVNVAHMPPDQARQAAYGSQGQQSNNDPPAFTGNYATAPTGFPGAYTGSYSGSMNAHPSEHGGTSGGVTFGGGGQSGYADPINDTSSNMIFKFQEAFLSGQAWAMRTRQDMVDAGLISPTDGPDRVIGAYAQMVKLSAGAVAKGQSKSPQDYIDQWKVIAAHDPSGPVTTSETSTSRTVYNAKDLAAAYQQTSTQALGRRATPAEAAAAAKAGQGAATPSVSTSTRTVRGNKATTNTTTREGAGPQAINEALLQHAMQNPEYGAYQAASTYFGALQQALGAVTSAGQ